MTALAPRDRTLVRLALGHSDRGAPAWVETLVDAATVVEVEPGTTVLEHGDGELAVVLDGLVEVRVDGRLVAHPGAGSVLGALRGRTLAPAGLSVVAATRARLALVPDDDVRHVVRRDVVTADAIHALVALATVGRRAETPADAFAPRQSVPRAS